MAYTSSHPTSADIQGASWTVNKLDEMMKLQFTILLMEKMLMFKIAIKNKLVQMIVYFQDVTGNWGVGEFFVP